MGFRCFSRIEEQIENDLLDLHGVCLDGRQVVGEFSLDKTAGGDVLRFEQLDGFADDFRDVDWQRAGRPFSNQMSQPTDDLARSERFLSDAGQNACQLFGAGWFLLAENFCRRGVVGDAGERLVQFMCQRADHF